MVEGLTYQLVYNLERHRLFNVRLRRWLIFLCLIIPTVMWLGVWETGHVTSALVTLGAAVTLVVVIWAGRQRYVRFVEYPHHVPAKLPTTTEGLADAVTRQPVDSFPIESPLTAMSKVGVHATGFFEISGLRRYFVETPAYYTTFETGEHCVMVQISLTRFLLLGRPQQDEVGWWYTFFQPSTIRSATNGLLYFGLRLRPALRLEIVSSDNPKAEILHLSFDDEATRSLVLADLEHGAAL